MDKQAWILKTILDEVTEEINERASENKDEADALLSEWFEKCGLMLEWVATGQIPQDDEFIASFVQVQSAERKELAR